MIMRHVCLTVFIVFAWSACGADSTDVTASPDGGVSDVAADGGITTDTASSADDGTGAADAPVTDGMNGNVDASDATASKDASTDVGATDVAMSDIPSVDSGAADTAGVDSGVTDTGSPDSSTTDGGSADAGISGVPASQVLTGLQYNGGVAFLRVLPGGKSEFVEISAPLLPSTKILYSYEDTKFPKTQAAMEAVSLKAALVYDDLLKLCAKDYPAITLLPPGSTKKLTPAQLETNFHRTAECSYKKYTAKPYWIPKLVDSVDICGLKLGPDWRMLNEADLLALQPSELKLIAKTITPPAGAFWGTFYFSQNVYIRQKKGGMALSPIANPPVFKTVEQVGASWFSDQKKWIVHLEGDWVLRCRRARNVIAGQ